MHTSYFARMNSSSFKGRDLHTVSIARSCRYYSGPSYPPLFPTWEMINLTRADTTGSIEEMKKKYEEMYREQILNKLDALKVYQDLGEDAILLCHESAAKCESGEDFCHRHMVAKWLEEELWLQYGMDVQITELQDDKQDLKKVLKDSKQESLW